MHLFIAIDGADPELARKYFKKIKEIGEIKDYMTYDNTGASFTSLITGLTPEQHGIYDLSVDTNLDNVRGEFIWNKVHSKFGTANIPTVWPPKPISGWMITGMMTPPGAVYSYPEKLTKELNDLGYLIWPEILSGNTSSNIIRYLWGCYLPYFVHHPLKAMSQWTWHNIYNMMLGMRPSEIHGTNPNINNRYWDTEWRKINKSNTVGFLYLMNTYPVDIALVCYKALDPVQHRLFNQTELIKEWYEMQDEETDKLIKGLKEKPESITIFSDHGMHEVSHGYIHGEHRVPGMFLSTLPNHVTHIREIFNLMLECDKK